MIKCLYILNLLIVNGGKEMSDKCLINEKNINLENQFIKQHYKWKTVDELTSITELPDPFLMSNGIRVSNQEGWYKHRHYLKEMLAHYMYGHMPPRPDNLEAENISQSIIYNNNAVEKIITIKCGPSHKVKFNVRIVYPNLKGIFPVIIKNDSSETIIGPAEEEIVVNKGYAVATFNREALAPDAPGYLKGIYPLYPNYNWGAIAVWAWGHMRVIDYLETQDYIDLNKICVTGFSRGGKAAICAAVYDERISVVAPDGSGCGGTGCLRFLGGHNGLSQDPTECETVGRITKAFPYWWCTEFLSFGDSLKPHYIKNETKLPFDLHFLRALVAPRACLTIDGFSDDWANPYGTQMTWYGAQPVYDFLGVSEHNAIFIRDGYHEQTAEDWLVTVDFCNKILYGKVVKTVFNNIKFTDAPKPFNWDTPDI
jgi:hypothetical protein